MRGRPSSYNDQDVLIKAQNLFWTKGYTATSLSELFKVMGMGNGSFYNAYKGGKKELFKKAIEQRREAFNTFKIQLEKSETPLELIKDFYKSIAHESNDSHLKGCLIVNTVVEMTFLDEDLEKDATRILQEVEEMYTAAIARAQATGQMNNTTPAHILGKYLITFWSGLNVLRRIYPDQQTLTEQIEMQLSILN